MEWLEGTLEATGFESQTHQFGCCVHHPGSGEAWQGVPSTRELQRLFQPLTQDPLLELMPSWRSQAQHNAKNSILQSSA